MFISLEAIKLSILTMSGQQTENTFSLLQPELNSSILLTSQYIHYTHARIWRLCVREVASPRVDAAAAAALADCTNRPQNPLKLRFLSHFNTLSQRQRFRTQPQREHSACWVVGYVRAMGSGFWSRCQSALNLLKFQSSFAAATILLLLIIWRHAHGLKTISLQMGCSNKESKCRRRL